MEKEIKLYPNQNESNREKIILDSDDIDIHKYTKQWDQFENMP